MVTGNGFAARSKQRGLDALLNVIIYPAPDLEGQWIAHCLETDMIVQADSDHDAFEAMAESIEAIAKHNVSKGSPAIEYHSAPPEVFAMFKESEDLAIRSLHIPAQAVPPSLDQDKTLRSSSKRSETVAKYESHGQSRPQSK